MRKCKLGALWVARTLGLFHLARFITRRRVRIFGYHGIWLGNNDFKGDALFMRADTFRDRMAAIQRKGYPVISLDHAVAGLFGDAPLPPCAVVLTIDDGWHGVHSVMLPELRRRNLPATLYVDTANVLSDDPVEHVKGAYERRFVAAGEADPDAVATRAFHYVTPELLCELGRAGIDLQLHTHSHTMHRFHPEDVREEIERNREALAEMTGEDPDSFRHLGYPSGRHDPKLKDTLVELNVTSATTVERRLADRSDDPHFLPRLLDSDKNPMIEFEAELSGFKELARGLVRATKRVLTAVVPVPREPRLDHAPTAGGLAGSSVQRAA